MKNRNRKAGLLLFVAALWGGALTASADTMWHWPLDALDSGVFANAAGTGANPGVPEPVGTPPIPSTGTKKIGAGSVLFDDANGQRLDLGQEGLALTSTAVTISAWVRPQTRTGNDLILARTGSGNASYALRLINGAPRAGVLTAEGGWTVTPDNTATTVPANQWSHVAMIYDGSHIRCYLNGAQDGNGIAQTGAIKTQNLQLPVAIGSHNGDQAGSFDGFIDDAALWDFALSPGEMQCLHDVGDTLGYDAGRFAELKAAYDSEAHVTVGAWTWRYRTNLWGAAGLHGTDGTMTLVFDDENNGGLAVGDQQEDPGRIWLGPDYWATRLQDWYSKDGRIECHYRHSDERTVYYLPYQFGGAGTLTTRVTVVDLKADFQGWVGFLYGSKNAGLKDEYRHNAIFGNGIRARLFEHGELKLWDVSQTGLTIPDEAVLELTVTQTGGGGHTSTLTLYDGATSNQVGQVTRVATSEANGSLALVCSSETSSTTDDLLVAFKDWTVSGTNLRGGPGQRWGPVLWTQYTLSRNVLKMSAQFPPLSLGNQDTRLAQLEVYRDGSWIQVDDAEIDDAARVALFRVLDWNETEDVLYRVVYVFEDTPTYYEGTIRKDPVDKHELRVAGFTGNQDYGFPNNEIVANVATLDPDMLFFSGDQIYEGVGNFPVQKSPLEPATLNYLNKYYLFGWAFGDLMRNRPTVILPDDHDVFQGNLWGQGGRSIGNQNNGGYVQNAEWVKMVHRTQTAHLPDPYDPTPILQDIPVFYGNLVYGRVSFAILEDRKWKTGPGSAPPDLNDAVQLGQRQLDFLSDWATDWNGCDMKATLSATVFAQCHTHGGNNMNVLSKDKDANGWPPPRRDVALREIRKAFAFMLAGDNHLPSVAHHGVDDWEDAGVSFTVPSIAAGFPRGWYPDLVGKTNAVPGLRKYTSPLPSVERGANYVGRYNSAWEHPLSMLGVANPSQWINTGNTTDGDIPMLGEKSSGFGMVRFNKATRKITIECYRIQADLNDPDTAQYPDWPIVIDQFDNYGRSAYGTLPVVGDGTIDDPVVQVIDESTGEILYTIRSLGPYFRPHVFTNGSYTVKVSDPDAGIMMITSNQVPVVGVPHALHDFTGDPLHIPSNSTATLSWNVEGSEGVTLDPVGEVDMYTRNGIGRLDVTPATSTVYTLVSTNGTQSLDARVQIRVYETLQAWRERHFSAADLADPTKEATVWGDQADPEEDGIANLYEYAMTTDPNADSTDALPEIMILPYEVAGETDLFLSIAFPGVIQIGGLRYEVECSLDLEYWEQLADWQDIQVSIAERGTAHTPLYTRRDTRRVVTYPQERCFFRLVLNDNE